MAKRSSKYFAYFREGARGKTMQVDKFTLPRLEVLGFLIQQVYLCGVRVNYITYLYI